MSSYDLGEVAAFMRNLKGEPHEIIRALGSKYPDLTQADFLAAMETAMTVLQQDIAVGQAEVAQIEAGDLSCISDEEIARMRAGRAP